MAHQDNVPLQALIQFLEHAPQAVAVFDTHICYLAANQNWLSGYGLGDRDIIGKSHYEIFPEIGDDWKAIHQRVLGGDIDKNDLAEFPRGDGIMDYIRWEVRPWYASEGVVGGIIMYTEVITEQVETAQKLVDSQKQNATIIESIPDLMFVFDSDGVYLDAKESPELLAPREVLIGQKITDVIPGEIGKDYLRRFREVLETGQESTLEYDLEVPVGKLSYEARIIKLDEERVLLLVRDVTERKQMSENAERLYQLERALVNVRNDSELLEVLCKDENRFGAQAASLLYIESDADNQPTMLHTAASFNVNPEAEAVTMEQSSYPLTNDALTRLWIANPNDMQAIANINTDSRVDDSTREQLTPFGLVGFVVVPMNQLGRWVGIITYSWAEEKNFTKQELNFFRSLPALVTPIADNIRLIKELESTVNELKIASRIAAENSRLKSEFLATMSHEMRTPMNAIEGFTSIMLSKMGGASYNDKTESYLQKVNSNSKRLLALINDFLDLSRIESGRLELANMPINPAQMAARWHHDFGVLAETKALKFIMDISPDVPDVLYGDEESITKIAVNLLGNAFKFTDSGSVHLTLTYQDGHLVFSVADTGIGIPPHAREYIFDEFRQVDQSSKREYGGTGLGLTIVQRLARAMGGTVTLDSDLGKGSTFTIRLPLKSDVEVV